MNYRHSYHAGSAVDVVKHVVLMALLMSLKQKPTPFCYIDTHAGAGLYDLLSEEAEKTGEYLTGIERIRHAPNAPDVIKNYLECIASFNAADHLRYYPGSPSIAHYLLRKEDRAILCELHPDECQSLRNLFKNHRQIAVHHQNGFLAAKAFLPPPERRGLVFIDPPYEKKDEFDQILSFLNTSQERWPSGIYAIWYPIKNKSEIKQFHVSLKRSKNEVFSIELTTYPDIDQQLSGGGLAILNPPWQLENTLKEPLFWLWNALSINKQGSIHAHSLK